MTVGSAAVSSLLHKTLYYEPVVGGAEPVQRVQIVEVFGECLELVGRHVEHFERA